MRKIIILLFFSIVITQAKSAPKELNNLVKEFYNRQNVMLRDNPELSFQLSSPAWIFLSLETTERFPSEIKVSIDGAKTFNLKPGTAGQKKSETMYFLKAGRHKLALTGPKNIVFRNLILRQVPEMLYCSLGYDPVATAGECFGPYDLDFLDKSGFLATTNVMIIRQSRTVAEQYINPEKQNSILAQWKQSGKKLFNMSHVSRAKNAKNYSSWAAAIRPEWTDGIIVDEFGTSHDLDSYASLLKKLHKNFPNKSFYPWFGHGYVDDDLTFDPRKGKGEKFVKFINTLTACGYKFVPERYFSDFWTNRQEAFQCIKRTLARDMKLWQKTFPGCEKNMIICVNSFVLENCSRNVNAANDYKVIMDYVMYCLANASEFKGLYGVMAWGSRGADPETMRWQAALQRHYCLEGRKEMLSKKYGIEYKPGLIENPDFEYGIKGWNIKPAEKNSIKSVKIEDLGVAQGRKPAPVLRGKLGNCVVCMIRSAKTSNRISQNIKNLIPGKTYSVKVLSVNPDDLKRKQLSKLNIEIKNVDLLNELSRCFLYTGKRKKREYHYCTYHYLVFRAKNQTAELAISDFPAKTESGSIQNKTAINFIEVQPYFE